MADWADISNLWWLRPRNPGGQSSIPAFALGAQMQQNRIQNDIKTKEMALDQQYRMDMLRQQDRMTTARIQDYDRIASERQSEEEDMLALKDVMGPMAEGKSFDPPTFKTEKGWRAFSQLNNSFSLDRWRKRLGSEAQKQQAEYYEKLAAVKSYAPDVFASMWQRIQEDGQFTPDMISQIEEIYQREVAPRITQAPEGMEQRTIRQELPGGGYVTFQKPTPQRTERLSQAAQDVANSEYRRRRSDITKQNEGRRPTDKGYNAETEADSWRLAEEHAARVKGKRHCLCTQCQQRARLLSS